MSASIPKDPLFAKGGKVRRCRYCSSSRMSWARDGRRVVVHVGSMCAPVAALASPSTFAVVGDDVPISQSRPEGGEGSYCGVPPCRGRFAPSLLLIYM